MLSWKIAHTLNCIGDPCMKKYTVLNRCQYWANHTMSCNILERITTKPSQECWCAEAIQGLLLVVATKIDISTEWRYILILLRTYLMNCGMGNVLSNPRAAYPSAEMKKSDRPKIKNSIVWTKLETHHTGSVRNNTVDNWSRTAILNAHIRPAKNSICCEYVGHCQNEYGRVETCKFSGLVRGRYVMQMYNSASYKIQMSSVCVPSLLIKDSWNTLVQWSSKVTVSTVRIQSGPPTRRSNVLCSPQVSKIWT